MNLHTAYRVSLGATLAISTMCLGYVDPVMPMAFYFAASALMVLALAFETRWSMPSSIANILGILILLAWLGWLALGMNQLNTATDISEVLHVVLPRMAPLLSLLVLAKLLRPKVTSDHWLIHSLGLVQIVLACVLALLTRRDRNVPLFPLMLIGYGLFGTWCMMIYAMHRDAILGARRRDDGYPQPPKDSQPWLWGGLVRAMIWFFATAGVALGLFFGVPRPPTDPAQSLSSIVAGGSGRVGYTQQVDVRDIGRLDTGDEPEAAIYIQALDSTGRKVRLEPEQYFRGGVSVEYRRGLWEQTDHEEFINVSRPLPSRPEQLRPGELELTFDVDMPRFQPRSHSLLHRFIPTDLHFTLQSEYDLFLAEPAYSASSGGWLGPLPEESSGSLMYISPTDSMVVLASPIKPSRFRYRQIYRIPTPMRETRRPVVDYTPRLPPPGTPQFNPQLRYLVALQRLRTQGRQALLPSEVNFLRQFNREIIAERGLMERPGDFTHEAWIERKARALQQHLAFSGEFSYSLMRTRTDSSLDPTVDFLMNTKQGHCELFASALVLLLRAEGIPARLVHGFRGAEWNERLQSNVVYQHHAHTWVEALIGKADYVVDEQFGGPLVARGYWVSLDPTPAFELPLGRPDVNLEAAAYYWESLFLDFNRATQKREIWGRFNAGLSWILPESRFWDTLLDPQEWTVGGVLIGVAVGSLLLACVILIIRLRRRRSAWSAGPASTVAFYNRLLAILKRLHLQPRPSQTPQEFIFEASGLLSARVSRPIDETLLMRLVRCFYGVRYGEKPLSAKEAKAVEEQLDTLKSAIPK